MPQTLNDRVRKHEVDTGTRDGVTSAERERVKQLDREVKEAASRQQDSQACERFFRPGGACPPIEVIRRFIDEHRDAYGVEPLCKVLLIALSGYRRYAALWRQLHREEQTVAKSFLLSEGSPS